MEQRENGIRTVPQFGGWEDKAHGATDYSMVFSRARENKKNKKTDLIEVKPQTIAKESDLVYDSQLANEDPAVMRKKKILTYINCCIRP